MIILRIKEFPKLLAVGKLVYYRLAAIANSSPINSRYRLFGESMSIHTRLIVKKYKNKDPHDHTPVAVSVAPVHIQITGALDNQRLR